MCKVVRLRTGWFRSQSRPTQGRKSKRGVHRVGCCGKQVIHILRSMNPNDRQECKHFTGLCNAACAIGVEYSSVFDVSKHSWLPCLHSDKGRESKAVCDKFESITAEQIASRQEEESRFTKSIDNRECPFCGSALTLKQVGLLSGWACKAHGVVRRALKPIND